MDEENFEAQVLLKGGGSVYTRWMPREADYLRATADLIDKAAANLVVQVFTRSTEAGGDGHNVQAGRAITLDSPGTKTVEWGPHTGHGMNGLVRYRITAVSLVAGSWVIFRMLPELWFDAVIVRAEE